MRLLLAAACAAALALCSAAPAGAAVVTTTLGGVETDVHFTEPQLEGQPDLSIVGRAKTLIDDVPATGWIAISQYAFGSPEILKALTDAKAEGVRIWVLHSGDQQGKPLQDAVADVVGANHRYCRYDIDATHPSHACISDRYGNSEPIQHAKYMLLSQTKNRQGALRNNVLWYGSANFAPESGTERFNDAVTHYGEYDLFGYFHNGMWWQQWNAANNPWYRTDDFYATSRGRYTSPTTGIEVHASPSAPGKGDMIVDMLDRITPGTGCEVRVSAYWFTRTEVRDKLVEMKGDRCNVAVLYDRMECTIRRPLTGAGIVTKWHPALHEKAIVAKGVAGNMVVITGSHNLNYPSLHANDEILVRIPANATLYQAYVDHFTRAWTGPRADWRPDQCP